MDDVEKFPLVGHDMRNDIVVKFLNGATMRGFTLGIRNTEILSLTTMSGETKEVRISDLKGVFVAKKSADPNRAVAASARVGHKLHVEFFDEEAVVGVSFDYNRAKDWFFLFPLGLPSKYECVLVNKRATAKVMCLGTNYHAAQTAAAVHKGLRPTARR